MTKRESIKVFSSNEVKKAGKALMENRENKDALEVLSYFRADHEGALENAYKLVQEKAFEIDENALIAKRLKRTPSIIDKLIRFKENNTQLSTMQDIGGCRVIFNNIKKVYKLVKVLQKDGMFKVRNDYIENPKKDGYRSIHLIGKFDNGREKSRSIELQVRTSIQHSWATAIEIVDLFTSESIKCNQGSEEWKEFFSSVSMQFILLENNPYLYSNNEKQLLKYFEKDITDKQSKELFLSTFKVFALSKKLDLRGKLNLFKESIKITSEAIAKNKSNGYVLINIKFVNKKYEIESHYYSNEDFEQASLDYLECEKISLQNNSYVTALVSTTAIGGIKEAYPNYFADSTNFLRYLDIINRSFERNESIMKDFMVEAKGVLHSKNSTKLHQKDNKNLIIDNFKGRYNNL